jgi:hypothetical protein
LFRQKWRFLLRKNYKSADEPKGRRAVVFRMSWWLELLLIGAGVVVIVAALSVVENTSSEMLLRSELSPAIPKFGTVSARGLHPTVRGKRSLCRPFYGRQILFRM